MGRTVDINGGINRIDGPIEVLDVHGGVVNISGRVGACNHFGGVINGAIGKPKVEVVYRDKERVVYRDRIIEKPRIVYRDAEMTDDALLSKITRLENELAAERKAHRQEVNELKERLDGALEAYHNLLHPTPDDRKPYRTYDDYRPTKQECEAVYKNLKVWLECEQELEPINL
jgi:hypothetical protein